jgi:hypothetical protein
MELEIIMLSKVSQSHKDKYCMLFLYVELWEANESKRGKIKDVK